MRITRFIVTLLVSVSIALAGVPLQAKQPCPMMKMQQHMAMQGMEKSSNCNNCPEMQKQQSQKKGGCCDDAACNLKCSAALSITIFLDANKTDLPALTRQTERLHPLSVALAPHFLYTQDRPPKHFS